MLKFNLTASENTGMQKGFLTSYQMSVNSFMTKMVGVGRDANSAYFASVVQELKEDTVIAFYSLISFKKEIISTNLLELHPEKLQEWDGKLHQLVRMQVQPTLDSNIKSLSKSHPELFNFTKRDVCRETSKYIENPRQMSNASWILSVCVLHVLSSRFYHYFCGCILELAKRTDEASLSIYDQRFEAYKKQKGALQINHLKMSCERLVGNGKMTMVQYYQLYDSIFEEIKDENLRYLVKGNIDNKLELVKELRLNHYNENTLDQVFCASIKRDELKRIYEQKEKPEELNYSQKLTAFLTECVKDVQAGSYSKDGDKLIRGIKEWFYVFRIFEEKEVKGLDNCSNFVEELNKVNIKVMKLPLSAENLYKTKQVFKKRLFPNWVPPEGTSKKFPRLLELGAATLKAYEKYKHLLA